VTVGDPNVEVHALKSPLSNPSSKILAAKTGCTDRTGTTRIRLTEKTIKTPLIRVNLATLISLLLGFHMRKWNLKLPVTKFYIPCAKRALSNLPFRRALSFAR
jgi:hypothetical protein